MTEERTPGAATADPAGGGAGPRRPLVRSDNHRVVAGVCGGLGRHLDIDPVVFRVVVTVLCLSGGLGLFLYGLAWLIVPAEDSRKTEMQRVLTGHVDAQSIGAVLLTVIGTGVFFSWMDRGDHVFPLLLLGVLIFFAVRYDPERRRHRGPTDSGSRGRGPDGEEPPPRIEGLWQQRQAQRKQYREQWQGEPHGEPHDTPSPTGYRWDARHPERNPYAVADAPAPPPDAAPAWWQREDLPVGDPLRKPVGAAAPPMSGPPMSGPPMSGTPSTCAPRRYHPGHHPPYQRERSFLGPFALLLALTAGATVWAVSGGQSSDVRLTTVLAAVLLVLGLFLMLAARRGRTRGLVLPALLTTLALAAAGTSDLPLKASVGDRTWVPASVTQVEQTYSLGAGDATLDLSAVDPGGGTVATAVRLGAGSLVVTVPHDTRVQVTVRSAAGDVRLPDGSRAGGVGNEHRADLSVPTGVASHGTITLDLEVGLGNVEVIRR